ncbi:hypothetical protein GGR50DRAFT_670412 [Xylaria sp. CBS 124048]|nr:hypothetical protein GGR50DRAFT_670412 [Xylaria sp. CBS 124048]
MATRTGLITAQLRQLSLRSASTLSSASPATKKSAGRPNSKDQQDESQNSTAAGFGEKIFVFAHFTDGMTVFSHYPKIKPNRALRQFAYTGKKLTPVDIRKDYWRPMAMIEFPKGHGEVGKSVYQLLLECKTLHAYSWGDEMLYDDHGRTLTKRARGVRLNDQRTRTIADIAAVLGGLGKGSKILLGIARNNQKVEEGATDAVAAAATKPPTRTKDKNGNPLPVLMGKTLYYDTLPPGDHYAVCKKNRMLVRATVSWADMEDQNYARKWTENVTHKQFVGRTFAEAEDEVSDGPSDSMEAQTFAPVELVTA